MIDEKPLMSSGGSVGTHEGKRLDHCPSLHLFMFSPCREEVGSLHLIKSVLECASLEVVDMDTNSCPCLNSRPGDTEGSRQPYLKETSETSWQSIFNFS